MGNPLTAVGLIILLVTLLVVLPAVLILRLIDILRERKRKALRQRMLNPNPSKAGSMQSLWNQLVGEDLSGVVFVRNYLQLQFNPPLGIDVYSTRIIVSADNQSAAFGEDAFANLAIRLIGRFVREVIVDGQESFRIVFTGGAEITISLRPEYYQCAEALEFHGRDNQWAAI